MNSKILVIGDSYMNADVFVRAFDSLGIDVDAVTVTKTDTPRWEVGGLREYEGDPAEVSSFMSGYEIVALHGAPVTREVLERNPSVRLIGCARGGPVNVDLSAAQDLGVAVTTTPGKNAEAVADLAIGFVIDLLRNVGPAVREVDRVLAAGEPLAESAFEGARWFGAEMKGCRLGLVGLGNVAQRVATRALSLGMNVSAFDPFVPLDAISDVRRVGNLDDLLTDIDVLSIHARATAENVHLIGPAQLQSMPRGSLLINTARESLVDEYALLDALKSGQIGGAALDVCETDGPWRDLVRLPSVILTPHIAGATHETLARGADMLASEVAAFVAGKELRWRR